jgi:hypothetical protein
MRLSHIGGHRTHVRVTVPLAVALPPPWWGDPPHGVSAGGSAARGVERRASVGTAPPGAPWYPPEDDAGHEDVLPEDPLEGVVEPELTEPPWEALEDPGVTDFADVPPDPFEGVAEEPLIPCLDLPPAPVAELEGYGPITPDVARALALGGTWQRLVTDPATGALLDVGRTRYQPPAELAAFVRERDGTCVRPGCGVSARSCELDHTVPWSQGGTTAVVNLGALCERDHAIKTLGAYRVRNLGAGVYEWSTPTGHLYRREADGTTTALGLVAAGVPAQGERAERDEHGKFDEPGKPDEHGKRDEPDERRVSSWTTSPFDGPPPF